MFPDSCPGTSKYLEVHYACVSAKNPGSSNARKVPPWMRKGGGGSKVNNGCVHVSSSYVPWFLKQTAITETELNRKYYSPN